MGLLCCDGLDDCFPELVDHSPLGAFPRWVLGVRLGHLLSILLMLYRVHIFYSKIQINAAGVDVYPRYTFWAGIVLGVVFLEFRCLI